MNINKLVSFPQDILLIIITMILFANINLSNNLALTIFSSLTAVVIFILWLYLRVKRHKDFQFTIKILKLLEIQVLESSEIIQQIHLYLSKDLKICISNIIINNDWFNDILTLRNYLSEHELRQIIDLMYHFDSLQKNYGHWTTTGDENLKNILKSNISPSNSDLIDEINSVRDIVIRLKSSFNLS